MIKGHERAGLSWKGKSALCSVGSYTDFATTEKIGWVLCLIVLDVPFRFIVGFYIAHKMGFNILEASRAWQVKVFGEFACSLLFRLDIFGSRCVEFAV